MNNNDIISSYFNTALSHVCVHVGLLTHRGEVQICGVRGREISSVCASLSLRE